MTRAGWSSTIRPAYMTMTRSVASSTTPRSWLIKMAVNPRSACRSLIVFMTACCTITSSAVVGSSNTISRGCRASASAIETRCRMPPDSSCGNRLSTSPSRRTLSSSSAPRRRMPGAETSSPGRACALSTSPNCLPMLRTGFSAFIPLCRTSAKPLRRCRRSCSPLRLAMSVPSKRMLPPVSRAGGRSIRVRA